MYLRIPLALLLGWAVSVMADEVQIKPGKQTKNWFNSKIEKDGKTQTAKMPYILFVPQDYQPAAKKPLLLFLHGYGESGDGNFELIKVHGPPKLVEDKEDFPFVTISPQCPKCPPEMEKIIAAWNEDQVIDLLDHVAKHVSIDTQRIYVTGLSMGGFGTWRILARYSDRFAAAVPICGGGRIEWANELKKVPIWAFHGAQDQVCTLSFSKSMVDAVRAAGGDVKLTIYPKANHDSWTQTYNNPKVYDWLLRQKKE